VRFKDGDATAAKEFYAGFIVIDTNHLVTHVGKAGRRHETHVT
jgi:hypothetical protein